MKKISLSVLLLCLIALISSCRYYPSLRYATKVFHYTSDYGDYGVISRVLEQTKFPRGYYYKIDYYPSNTFETGDYVYALLQRPAEKAIVRKIGFYNVPEAFRDSDAIVRVNVDTLEYTFLYETEKGDRIVGFMNDYVYVFMDMRSGTGKKVVKYTLEAEEVAIIARDLPKNESFEFSVGEDGLSITDEKGATEVYAM